MITFEQALTDYLEAHLETEVGPLLMKNSVAVNLSNYLELNRWQMQGIFSITMSFDSQLAASDAFTAVDELIKGIRYKPGVNWAQLINAQAQASSNTGEWTYQGIYQITHRVKNSWLLE